MQTALYSMRCTSGPSKTFPGGCPGRKEGPASVPEAMCLPASAVDARTLEIYSWFLSSGHDCSEATIIIMATTETLSLNRTAGDARQTLTTQSQTQAQVTRTRSGPGAAGANRWTWSRARTVLGHGGSNSPFPL